jgi:hypothetical protein
MIKTAEASRFVRYKRGHRNFISSTYLMDRRGGCGEGFELGGKQQVLRFAQDDNS